MLGETELSYQLLYKNVKNINLHIQRDGTLWVSCNRRHSKNQVEAFLRSKKDWITKPLVMEAKEESIPFYTEQELKRIVTELCERIFPYYEKVGIPKPQIKFRKMTSQWGNCRPKTGILTFNKNLCYAPYECIQYVVWHEWTHFLVPNHSKEFYEALETVCPDWKVHKKRLKEVKV